MIWTGWKSGEGFARNISYGLRISRHDRDRNFQKQWNSVLLELGGPVNVATVEAAITPSFWRKCSELRDAKIGKWLVANGLAPWPRGNPPQLKADQIGERRFKICPTEKRRTAMEGEDFKGNE